MDSLLAYLRGIMGIDFLKYPERDMWPNWSSKEYRERILEEYVTTDPRASKRDYFSILLEGGLLHTYHGIRRRFRQGKDEVGLHRSPFMCLDLVQDACVDDIPSDLPTNNSRRTKSVTWKRSVHQLQWRYPPCYPVSRCLCCTMWKPWSCESYLCSSSRRCSLPSSRSLRPRERLRSMQPQQRMSILPRYPWAFTNELDSLLLSSSSSEATLSTKTHRVAKPCGLQYCSSILSRLFISDLDGYSAV